MHRPPPLRYRRRLLRLAASSLAAAPLAWLAACGGRPATSTGPGAADATGGASADDAGTAWATGGTSPLANVRFPDPFAAGVGDACILTCQATIGPCHTQSPERRDLSDGWDGLPMRVALRVVDDACQPVEGAIVELWHPNRAGGYSGRAAAMCTRDQADTQRDFFRGHQRTDADGRVDFDTCYPGWYRGRAVHVHLRVLTGGYDPDDSNTGLVTTQLLFPDALNQQIFSGQTGYREAGQPDTSLASDGVVGGQTDIARYLFDIQRVQGGLMLASKMLVIRRDPAQALCEAGGRMPPGGRRGPPPRGGPGSGPPPGAPPQGTPRSADGATGA